MATYVNCGNGTYLNARTGASTSDPIKYYIPHGEEVTTSTVSGNWTKVYPTNYSSKGYAWVQNSYLANTKPTTLHNSRSSAFGNKTLQVGRFGRFTYNLQIALGITADGEFGTNTEAAVISFQSANSLTPDGLAGTKTLKKLWDASGATVTSNGI